MQRARLLAKAAGVPGGWHGPGPTAGGRGPGEIGPARQPTTGPAKARPARAQAAQQDRPRLSRRQP